MVLSQPQLILRQFLFLRACLTNEDERIFESRESSCFVLFCFVLDDRKDKKGERKKEEKGKRKEREPFELAVELCLLQKFAVIAFQPIWRIIHAFP